MTAPRCFVQGCAAEPTMIADVGDDGVPFCPEHYEATIISAQRNNPDMDPDAVRSCMERAAYPVTS